MTSPLLHPPDPRRRAGLRRLGARGPRRRRGGEPSPPRRRRALADRPAGPRRRDRRAHRRLQAAVRAAPGRADSYAALAAAYLQRARETGDPGFYARADGLLRARRGARRGARPSPSSAAGSRSPATTSPARSRDAGRRGGSRPTRSRRYPVLVDALVELGRYDEADARAAAHGRPQADARRLRARLLPARAARRPRRRRGRAMRARRRRRRPGARERRLRRGAARRARARARATPAAARQAFAAALAAVPGHVPAAAGPGAARRAGAATWPRDPPLARRSSARRPLPEYVIALGEAELAAGRRAAARERPRAGRAPSRRCSARPA